MSESCRKYKGDNVEYFECKGPTDPLAPNTDNKYGESVNGMTPMGVQLWDKNDGCIQAPIANAIAPGCSKAGPLGVLKEGEGAEIEEKEQAPSVKEALFAILSAGRF
jgi:hypothetical protein